MDVMFQGRGSVGESYSRDRVCTRQGPGSALLARGSNAKGGAPPEPSRLRPARSIVPCGFSLRRQRPKFIAPTSPNDVFEPSSPIGMLMLGLMLNRELNTNPVPSVSSP